MLRNKEQALEKIEQFKKKLQKTIVFWPRNVLNKIAIEEDRLFLLNMMGPRTASFGSTDKKFAATRTKIEQWKAEKQHRQLKEQKRAKSDSIRLLFATSDSSSEEFVNANDTDCLSSSKKPARQVHKCIVKTGTTITIPHDVLKSQLLNVYDCKSNTASVKVATILHSLVTACDGDAAKLNLYHSQAHRLVKYKIVF